MLGASRCALRVTGLLVGLATSAAAQSLTVRVVDDSSRVALAGALVRLVLHDSVVAQALTNERGRVTIAVAAGGHYTVRVGRIGFVVTKTWTVDLEPGTTRTLDIGLVGERVMLPTVVVTGERRCGGMPRDRSTAATLWEQIRQALTATQLSQAGSARYRISTFERDVTPQGVTRAERHSRTRVGTGKPFGTLPPELLARDGFVRVDGDDRQYFGPDAELLLSDAFVDHHCFQVQAPPDSLPDHVGLGFEPAKRPKSADIRGVLWVDRKSAELRLLEFRFVGPEDVVSTVGDSRGWIRFDREPGGQWYISDWTIRMPKVARIRRPRDFSEPARDSLLGYVEQGGGAEPADRPRVAAQLATVSGVVYDSLRGHGLGGVIVTVAGASDSAVTDADGRFSLSAPIGRRLVGFRHPLLALLPDRTAVDLAIESGGAHVETATVGPGTLAASLCGGTFGRAAAVGRVLLNPGDSAAGRVVRASYFSKYAVGVLSEQTISTVSDARGLWAICDLPPVRSVVVRQLDGHREVAKRIVPVQDQQAAWVDFGGEASVVTALALRVVDGGGRPVPAAELTLPDLGWTGVTDQDGRFVLAAAPVGELRLSVRAVGQARFDTTITVAAADSAVRELRLPGGAPGAAVASEGADSTGLPPKMRAFERRRQEGIGRFFDRAAIDGFGRQPLAGVLRRVPRVRLIEQGGQAAIAASQRGSSGDGRSYEAPWPSACYLQVIIDGVRVWIPGTDPRPYDINQIRLESLAGIEIYTGADTPGELTATGSVCGAIVLWTR